MMTLERALTLATGADNGELNPLWREVLAVLVAEVTKSRVIDKSKGCWMDDGQDVPLPDTCVIDDGKPEDCVYARGLTTHGECEYWKDPSCQINEETNDQKGPLSSSFLADYADQLADTLADFAGELNLSGVQYETDSLIITAHSQLLVKLAGRIRAEK